MGFRECAARATAAALLFACATQAMAQSNAPAPAPAPKWQDYLKRPSIESIEISPDGKRIAVAVHGEDRAVITVRDALTLAVEKTFDSGSGGEVGALRWVDDNRFLVAANRVNKRYNVAFNDPVLAIIGRDGESRTILPDNFVATIEGEPEHLLVSRCKWAKGGCIQEVRKVKIGYTSRQGEKIIDAPEHDAHLLSDLHGRVRFASSVDDKGQSKLHALAAAEKGWTLVNDSEKSHLHVWPLGVDADGESAFIEAERATGPSVVERYEFATGKRTELYRNPQSDVVMTISAFDGITPIGAYYQPTNPRPVIWNPQHPDADAIQRILLAFPGRVVSIWSATRDRSKAIVKTVGDRDAGTWYLYDRNANSAKVLGYGRSWLPEGQVPGSREVKLTARDGVPLYGVLTLPPDGRGLGLPMIVVPHGGPHGVYDIAYFDQEAALLASHGYAVLRVNYRGSGGYGREFEGRGYKQWGRAMQDDVTDATRWAIDQGIADAKRICLYGASYGGYAALMGAVREPTLYRCVAGFAAPYDLAKLYRWGNLRRSDYGLEYLARVIGKDPADLAARSPAKLADAIKVPVFLAHGRADGIVDIAHSRAMVKAMRKAGLMVEFQEYARSGHGLQIEADEVDFYTRLLAFIGKHTAPQ